MRVASAAGADLVVANDPDADRCAVAVPGAHGWQVLRGDEVGALLGDFLLRSGVEGVYASSIVSSSLLGTLAAAHGQPHVETLTGFKWIGRVEGLVFGSSATRTVSRRCCGWWSSPRCSAGTVSR
jgi:phosphomannomutase